MAGYRNGVKTQILAKELRALFTHCYGHSLSSSVTDTVKLIQLLQNTMDTVHEINKFLQYSSKQSSVFKDIKCDISPDTMGFQQSGQSEARPSVVFWRTMYPFCKRGKACWRVVWIQMPELTFMVSIVKEDI